MKFHSITWKIIQKNLFIFNYYYYYYYPHHFHHHHYYFIINMFLLTKSLFFSNPIHFKIIILQFDPKRYLNLIKLIDVFIIIILIPLHFH